MNKKVIAGILTGAIIATNPLYVNALSKSDRNKIDNAIKNYMQSVSISKSTDKQSLNEYLSDLRQYSLKSIKLEEDQNSIKLDFNYYENKEDLQHVIRLASQIYFETQGMSDIEKVYYISQRVIKILDYAQYNSNDIVFSPVSIIKGEAVCQGYARLAGILFSKVGIQNTFIEGYLNGNTPHLWNAVKINDEWFYVDLTSADKGTKVDFNYILMNDQNIKDKGYKINYTKVIGSNSDIQLIKHEGLYSKLNKKFYFYNEDKKLYSYKYKTQSLDFVDICENFFIVGGDLILVKDSNIINKNSDSIIYSNLEGDSKVVEYEGSLLVNDLMIFNSSDLPSELVKVVNNDYKVIISEDKKKDYFVEEIGSKTNIYYKNQIIIQFLRK